MDNKKTGAAKQNPSHEVPQMPSSPNKFDPTVKVARITAVQAIIVALVTTVGGAAGYLLHRTPEPQPPISSTITTPSKEANNSPSKTNSAPISVPRHEIVSPAIDPPIGTVIISFLDWAQFEAATNNKPAGKVWNSKNSKWAPADGRLVPGSAFETISNSSHVPDLRGMFLRGLNVFDREERGRVDAKHADPSVNRIVGDYQEDMFASHNHGGGKHTHRTGQFSGAATREGGVVFRTGSDRMHYPDSIEEATDVVKAEGGPETRPKNISVYYYIRIN